MNPIAYFSLISIIILFGVIGLLALIAFTVWMIFRAFNKYGIECIEFNLKKRTANDVIDTTVDFFEENNFKTIIKTKNRISGTFQKEMDQLSLGVMSLDSIGNSNIKINPTIIFDIILNQDGNDVTFEGYFYLDLWYGSKEYKFGRVQKLLNYILGGKYVSTRDGYKLKFEYLNSLGVDKRTMKKFTRNLNADEIWDRVDSIERKS